MNNNLPSFINSLSHEKAIEDLFSSKSLLGVKEEHLYSSFTLRFPFGPDPKEDYAIVYYLLDDLGYFHSDTLPSLIIIFSRPTSVVMHLRIENYYRHGILYRESGPASIRFLDFKKKEDKTIKETATFYYHQKDNISIDKKLQGKDFLAKIKEMADYIPAKGNICSELLASITSLNDIIIDDVYNTQEFSLAGPSSIIINTNNLTHIYQKNGKYHRDDGPAVIFFEANGEIYLSRWYLEGKLIEESK